MDFKAYMLTCLLNDFRSLNSGPENPLRKYCARLVTHWGGENKQIEYLTKLESVFEVIDHVLRSEFEDFRPQLDLRRSA